MQKNETQLIKVPFGETLQKSYAFKGVGRGWANLDWETGIMVVNQREDIHEQIVTVLQTLREGLLGRLQKKQVLPLLEVLPPVSPGEGTSAKPVKKIRAPRRGPPSGR